MLVTLLLPFGAGNTGRDFLRYQVIQHREHIGFIDYDKAGNRYENQQEYRNKELRVILRGVIHSFRGVFHSQNCDQRRCEETRYQIYDA